MAGILYLYAHVLNAHSTHARQTFQMLALMRAIGLEVDVLTLPGGDPFPPGLLRNVYRTLPVPFGRTMPIYGFSLRRRWATVLMTFAAARLCLHKRYTAIHSADRAIRAGAFVAWLFGTRFLFEWHAASGHDLATWVHRRSSRFLRLVNLIFTDLPCNLTRLRGSGLCGRIATIPALPAPMLRRLPLPAVRLSGATQAFRLVAFSLSPRLDDLDLLLDACTALLSEPNLRITFVGGTPRAAERLRRSLAERYPDHLHALEVAPEVRGFRELQAHLQQADLVWLPAVSEALPPPLLLDVMASQRAILAVRCPAYEAWEAHRCLALVPADAQDLVASIRQHLFSPLLCANHAAQAAETIERERPLKATTEALRRCYAFALTERAP